MGLYWVVVLRMLCCSHLVIRFLYWIVEIGRDTIILVLKILISPEYVM